MAENYRLPTVPVLKIKPSAIFGLDFSHFKNSPAVVGEGAQLFEDLWVLDVTSIE
jgi:hypothetical protein